MESQASYGHKQCISGYCNCCQTQRRCAVRYDGESMGSRGETFREKKKLKPTVEKESIGLAASSTYGGG